MRLLPTSVTNVLNRSPLLSQKHTVVTSIIFTSICKINIVDSKTPLRIPQDDLGKIASYIFIKLCDINYVRLLFVLTY